MSKLNNLSIKSIVLITFLVGVVTGSALFFSLNYSSPARADDEVEFMTEAYEDVVRFKAEGRNVSKIQVEIYALDGRRIYQGESTRQALDWHRTSDNGGRVNKGTYLYVTKAFSGNSLVRTSEIGKMFLKSKRIELQKAPSIEGRKESSLFDSSSDDGQNYLVSPKSFSTTGNIEAKMTSSNSRTGFHILDTSGNILGKFESDISENEVLFENKKGGIFYLGISDTGTREIALVPNDHTRFHVGGSEIMRLNSGGEVGIGTSNPDATLEVSGTSSDLLSLYNPDDSVTSAKFRVEKDGTVRADGTYYGADFVTGSGADVAERINTSEWVEKGNVVEIDPKHEGFFRKTKDTYSTKVAGVISSNPGVILGNDGDSSSSKWEDSRPMLALAGRVPVKANRENGPIDVGDTLVSSSQSGYAMKSKDSSKSTGAVIGKALEPLKEESGSIMAQVSLS